ncbi:MAG: lipopolysaccharide heptosyltransferase II [candidate division Zixibacteria bacterium]|nr:lipopolysaccharide heptosyltransferase II [candidate division Zixibacteria bacterium]
MAQNIIIRTPNHLGDCIMALPMINETAEVYPGATVTLLTPQHLADLFRPNPAIDGIIELPPEHVHGLISVYKIRDLIGPLEFDLGLILPPSFGAAAGFKLGRVKERIGYIADGRRLLLTKPLPLVEPIHATHRSELYFDLLRRGAGANIDYTPPKLLLNDKDMEQAAILLQRFGLAEDVPFAAIAFRAVAESRRWGRDNYVELIKRLITQYELKVVLIGSTVDHEEGNAIAEATSTKEVVNLAGKTDLREVAAILAGCAVFVGNDSGPAHLAAAVEAPIVVLSGADDPRSTTPLSPLKRLVFREELDCISCVKNRCPLKDSMQMQCMTGISLDRVMMEVDHILGK